VPEYSFEGPGLLLSGTSAGSPAEKAGMLAGDVLVKVGEIEIATIQDFMYALQSYKAGDVVLAVYLRDGVRESVRVTLATRDAQ
jgi:S1-C subfamily serine protease